MTAGKFTQSDGLRAENRIRNCWPLQKSSDHLVLFDWALKSQVSSIWCKGLAHCGTERKLNDGRHTLKKLINLLDNKCQNYTVQFYLSHPRVFRFHQIFQKSMKSSINQKQCMSLLIRSMSPSTLYGHGPCFRVNRIRPFCQPRTRKVKKQFATATRALDSLKSLKIILCAIFWLLFSSTKSAGIPRDRGWIELISVSLLKLKLLQIQSASLTSALISI